MYNTTKAMIENLASAVERFGFVPNGGRVYYLQRSQPPLLAGMVYEYYEVTKDKEFIIKMLPILEKELNFWNSNRMGVNYVVYRYNSKSNMPRPEAYVQDLKKAQQVHYKAEYWQVLPVDLNAFMCWNFEIMEYLYERIEDPIKSEFYREHRAKFRRTVHKVFYNHTAGSWFDFNLRTGLHNTAFYPSMTVPLFTGCYNTLNQGKSERLFTLMKVGTVSFDFYDNLNDIGVFEYPGGIPTSMITGGEEQWDFPNGFSPLNHMIDIGVFEYPGGIPTSMITGGEEQWDFPNGFSPLNHMIVEGLRKSYNAQMQDAVSLIPQISPFIVFFCG
ncbi:unnamed protein product [Strongylus vulgaris]|uniref:Trehalase n=1 Tax=Strongylus vulgaris TaxID=40348 RepID=A0A3P7JR88_STRVU|nr:unnamed protein product [Strongylus vulgaris]